MVEGFCFLVCPHRKNLRVPFFFFRQAYYNQIFSKLV